MEKGDKKGSHAHLSHAVRTAGSSGGAGVGGVLRVL